MFCDSYLSEQHENAAAAALELTVRKSVAAIDAPPDERLARALAAIPGVVTKRPSLPWILRIGPDRARTLLAIVDTLEVELDSISRDELEALEKRRSPDEPVIEITNHDGTWLSLMNDWQSFGIEQLRAIPGGREVEDADRFEVPLTTWTQDAIEAAVEGHGLRLSPSCELALREIDQPKAEPHPWSAEAAGPASEPPAPPEGFSMQEEGGQVVATTDPRGTLAPAFANLPGARSLGTASGQWLLPPTAEVAREVRRLIERNPALPLDDGSQRWLQEAPRWLARAEIVADGKLPVIKITTRWGDAPSEVMALPDLTARASSLVIPLTPKNLQGFIGAVKNETEVLFSVEMGRAVDWVSEHPEAERVPPAEIDVVRTPGGNKLVIDSIWNETPEEAFLAQEQALLNTGATKNRSDELPASAWPPDVLARFIRIHKVGSTSAATRLLQGGMLEDPDSERLLAMSAAEDGDLEVEGLTGELMPFQRAGVAYTLERRRLFLADEQGLGKTIQALAAIQADLAYPAVIVSPASLKLNWKREIGSWLPNRSTTVLSGHREQDVSGADLIVINYEIVDSHVDQLVDHGPRALVLDESHYVKNPKAARTKAVLELSSRIGPDSLRLALTGTPVVNRPGELATQLKAINRLGEFGSANSFTTGFRTGSSRRRLHERLRSSCYLRRKKADVLEQLPDKRRAVVTIPLDNEESYKRAERDFIRWLREQIEEDGTGKVPPDRRAEALVKMTALRRLAAEGKLPAAISWIDDFMQSEEKLVVFAHHRNIQAAVIERFPDAARIVGDDSVEEREENVRRFQSEDGPKLCVCSLEVGSHGFTLTAAANVAFLELAWTPAKHDQAEDRTHRIGQTESVTAWYLLAAETIDERIATLLEEKRGVVDSVTDGGEGGGVSIAGALMGDYALS
jgi:SWI/SNF-related matrix-associated actin-dependent regulator 1 of chromatin subfamily A